MNPRRRGRHLARTKQTIDPPEVFAYRPLASDSNLQLSARLVGGELINEPVSAKIDAVLPKASPQLAAFVAEDRSPACNLDEPFLLIILCGHTLVLPKTRPVRNIERLVLSLSCGRRPNRVRQVSAL